MSEAKPRESLKQKLNRRISELTQRVNKPGNFEEAEELRQSIRFALELSSTTEGYIAFLRSRQDLGLIDNVAKIKEFKIILKQCELVLAAKDDIFMESFKEQAQKKSPYTWEQKMEILNRRETANRRKYRGAGYKASRAS